MTRRRTVYHLLPAYLNCGGECHRRPGGLEVEQALAAFEAALGDGRGIEKVIADFSMMVEPRPWGDGAFPQILVSGMQQIVRRRCRPVPLLVYLDMPPVFYAKLLDYSPRSLQGAAIWGFRGRPEELLPFDEEQFEAMAGSQAPSASDAHAPPVLIVHGDEDLKRLVRTFLETADYRVIEADSRRSCMVMVEGHAPALVVFLTYELAGAGVPELIAELRATRFGQRARFIVSSGDTRPSRIGHAMRSGADGWLSKPFKREDLLDLVLRLVGPGKRACPQADPGQAQRSNVESEGGRG